MWAVDGKQEIYLDWPNISEFCEIHLFAICNSEKSQSNGILRVKLLLGTFQRKFCIFSLLQKSQSNGILRVKLLLGTFQRKLYLQFATKV